MLTKTRELVFGYLRLHRKNCKTLLKLEHMKYTRLWKKYKCWRLLMRFKPLSKWPNMKWCFSWETVNIVMQYFIQVFNRVQYTSEGKRVEYVKFIQNHVFYTLYMFQNVYTKTTQRLCNWWIWSEEQKWIIIKYSISVEYSTVRQKKTKNNWIVITIEDEKE